jgi:magnesium-transporting ATPase (P-type)
MSGGRTKGTVGTPLPSSTTPSASTGDDHENSSKAKLELKELVEKAKKTDPKMGLSSTEVLNRQREFGKNELPEKKISPILQFLSYLWGPMPIMIWIAIFIEVRIFHTPIILPHSLSLLIHTFITPPPLPPPGGITRFYEPNNLGQIFQKR